MIHFYLKTSTLALCASLISCTIENSSSAKLGVIAKQYQKNGDLIIDRAMSDFEGYERLGEMLDTFGHRLSGSSNLEKTLEWIIDTMKKDGLENVHGEEVMVPKWVRGREYARMSAPWGKDLAMLGLGGSVGTGGKELEGEVLVVSNFDELKQRAKDAKGKIILYNVPFTTYGKTVQYRYRGASEAAKVGAIASSRTSS